MSGRFLSWGILAVHGLRLRAGDSHRVVRAGLEYLPYYLHLLLVDLLMILQPTHFTLPLSLTVFSSNFSGWINFSKAIEIDEVIPTQTSRWKADGY